MRIITCVLTRQQYPVYEISYKNNSDEKATVYRYCENAEGAAATAIDLSFASDKYIIFGDKSVLDCIPKNLQSNCK